MRYLRDEVIKTINEKVRGKIEAAHSLRGHHYRFVAEDIVVDSVTTKNVLEMPHLIPWAIGLAISFLEEDGRWERLKTPEREVLITAAKLQYRDIRDDAGTLGGKAHNIIEVYERQWIDSRVRPADIKTFAAPDEDYRVIAAIRSAEAAFTKYKIEPLACELLVGDPKVGAGTLDLIALNDKGELELIDFKTSNSAKNDFYAMQVAAYRQFFKKMTGLHIKRARIFHLDKYSNRFHCYNIPEINDAYRAFKNLSKVYDWLNNKEEKIVEDRLVIQLNQLSKLNK